MSQTLASIDIEQELALEPKNLLTKLGGRVNSTVELLTQISVHPLIVRLLPHL